MGLDTTHDCWHGPYSSFSRWRNALASAAGYEVLPVKDDIGMVFDTVQIDWDGIAARNPNVYEGVWVEPPADPLLIVIVHSDCDGRIYPHDAANLVNRLEELLPKLNDIDSVKFKTEKFIAGLHKAVEANEPVEFH